MLYLKEDSKDCTHHFYLTARKLTKNALQMITQCRDCGAVYTTATDKWYEFFGVTNPDKENAE